MIVIDTSALIAMLVGEPEAKGFLRCVLAQAPAFVGAPTVFEYMMVAEGDRIRALRRSPTEIFKLRAIEQVGWSPALASIAHDAFVKYGKGRHPARLNFGDCMSYALAKSLDAPLLYKGSDFAQTDVVSAV